MAGKLVKAQHRVTGFDLVADEVGLFDLVETPGGLDRRRNAVADRFEVLARQAGEASHQLARRTR